MPADPSNPESWSGENKLAVVIETAAMNAQELAEYCRRKGLYVEQITRWRDAAIAGNEPSQRLTKAERQALQKERQKSRSLEKELKRKEKAPRHLLVGESDNDCTLDNHINIIMRRGLSR